MLIALSGGSPAEREAVSESLVNSGKVGLVPYVLREPNVAYPYRRLKVLSAALQGGVLRSRSKGVVVVHCLTEEEAGLVRDLGGSIWHLRSRPSGLVAIRLGDIVVTSDEHGAGHVRAPLEALSELMLAQAG